jgi:hypothetical protein
MGPSATLRPTTREGTAPSHRVRPLTRSLLRALSSLPMVAGLFYLSGQPTANAAAAPVPFAFTFDAVGNLIVTEAGSSDLASYSVASNGTVTKIGSAGDGQAALCWVTAVDGYFYGSNAGSANVSQFGETSDGVPNLVGVAASLSSGATDSAASSDGRYLYVEEGGIGTIAEFQVASAGALAQIGQVSELSAPLEGIAAS